MSEPTYRVTCRKCDGKGTTDGKKACDRCKGWGQVLSPSPVADAGPEWS